MKKVGILYILGFLVGMATGLFIPLSTLFLESKGVSENIIGMISSTYFVAMVVGSIIFLKICRKTDAYKLVISALLLAVIAIFVFVNSTKRHKKSDKLHYLPGKQRCQTKQIKFNSLLKCVY